MSTTQIVLARHGETMLNKHRILQGNLESNLSEAGREQALCLAGWCRRHGVLQIWSSNSRRATETAKVVAQYLNIAYQATPALCERNYGRFDGLTREELLLAREALGASTDDPTQDWAGIEGVESDGDIWARVKPIIDEVIDNHPESTTLVVTHAGVIKAVLHTIFEIPPTRKLCFKIPNGSTVTLRLVHNHLEMIELCPNPCLLTGEK